MNQAFRRFEFDLTEMCFPSQAQDKNLVFKGDFQAALPHYIGCFFGENYIFSYIGRSHNNSFNNKINNYNNNENDNDNNNSNSNGNGNGNSSSNNNNDNNNQLCSLRIAHNSKH